ncbi:MAG: AEC family transporter [Actinobacteria bacterium]|nr:AEC family transporter [Actinomycetota bacterium]
MLQVLVEILVPVYLVIAAGFLLARSVEVRPEGLAAVSYWVLGPVFVFDILATTELEAGVVGRVVGNSALAMVGGSLVAAALMRLAGGDASLIGAGVLSSIHGNVGNFGLAISAFAFGAAALPIAGIVMVTVNTLGILAGVGLATLRQGSVWKAAWTALTSPLALAVVPALAVNVAGLSLPLWLDRPVSLLAAALIPVMLLTLGIQIAGMRRVLPAAISSIPLAVKLVVVPLLAAGLVYLVGPSGMPGKVVILQAAMPAAVFTSLIALEHDLEADFVTTVLLVGTLASVLTLPVVITLL